MMQSSFGTAPDFSDIRRHIMATVVGSGMLLFTPVENWEKLPSGWEFIDVAGVAVDSKDNVYVFNRSEHPVIVFDRDGNFLRSWGEGLFSTRTHGIHIGPDDMVYCVDDGIHTVQKFSLDGQLLMTLGSPNSPAPKWQGNPFNRPTHVAVSPVTGHRSGPVHPTAQRGHRPG